ncbi:hypothetical protein AAEU29_14905 [Pseudoalteromonas sp. SSM20]|uniref:hypothetical protein n=1 Tax=Pseudoalteromonas sp. SSM20 TaxID=3139394 RepID=UPI003BAD2041
MKKAIVVLFSLLLGACNSTEKVKEPYFTQAPIKVDQSEVKEYWVFQPQKTKKFSGKRPSWLPEQPGMMTYKLVIDSNGNEVTKELISTTPNNWITQQQLTDMPKISYLPSDQNTNRVPVEVVMKLAVGITPNK